MPIVTLQATELLEDLQVSSLAERAEFYRDVLVSELRGYHQTIHIVGYSLSGALSFELALSLDESTLNCGSLCLIDPVPYCPRSKETKGDLIRRAKAYDLAYGTLLHTETNFRAGVSIGDITNIGELEHHALSAASEQHASEISRVVDTIVRLGKEFASFDISTEREKYTGPCAFFTAEDSPQFFAETGLDGCHHADGIYGWSLPLANPQIEAIPLACTHVGIFTHKSSVLKVASTLVSLYKGEATTPQPKALLHVVSNPIRSQEQWDEIREQDPSQNGAQLIHWYDPEHQSWQAQSSESCWGGWSTTGTPLLTESPWTPWESTLDQRDAPY